MKSIRESIGHELEWRQPRALEMAYELHDRDELAATLRFRSACGTLATVESAEGSWTFKRIGFWKTKVTVRPSGSEREIAVFRNRTWSQGGTLELADGRHYPADTDLWASRYEFTTESGLPLVRFHNRGLLSPSARVEILPAAAALAELPWLVALGWYLVVMMQSDTAAVVVATAATY